MSSKDKIRSIPDIRYEAEYSARYPVSGPIFGIQLEIPVADIRCSISGPSAAGYLVAGKWTIRSTPTLQAGNHPTFTQVCMCAIPDSGHSKTGRGGRKWSGVCVCECVCVCGRISVGWVERERGGGLKASWYQLCSACRLAGTTRRQRRRTIVELPTKSKVLKILPLGWILPVKAWNKSGFFLFFIKKHQIWKEIVWPSKRWFLQKCFTWS